MFFRDFWRCTSNLHTLGPWVKILISVLGTVLNIFKNIKFDLKKVLRSHFGIFYWGPHRASTLPFPNFKNMIELGEIFETTKNYLQSMKND